MCYTTYLFHQLAILNAGHVLDRFHLGNNPHLYFITEAVLILPFVGLVSVVYFVLIERPCMDSRWPSKLLAAMKSRTSKAASPKAVAELNPGLMSSEP